MRFIPLALLPFVLSAGTPAPTAYAISTVAGSSFVGDGGPATSAALSDAEGVAVDSAGNVYIADSNDHRVRKVGTDGTISTIAGDGFPGFRGDGGPASAARLNRPCGIAVDTAGNLYIADLGNNRIRMVSPAGTITTVSGTDKLHAPRNVAVDSAGNLYISEFGGAHVWMFAAGGTLQNVAGTGVAGFAGDGGPATAAQLSFPCGLAFDSSGSLYIADSSNNRVRKVANGIITTILGTGDAGTALPNQLNLPTGVAVDSAGNLDVADSNNQRIQQLTPMGAINTLPGIGRDLAFDGQPAPLFYVQDSEIMVQVPYEIAGKSTVDVEVVYQGQSHGTVTVPVAASAPGIFTVSAGTGLASAGNQDGTLNSTFDPAPRESIIALYATGEGITNPASADGQPAVAPYPQPGLPVSVLIGGSLAKIVFAGEAPGFSGLLQINAVVPTNLVSTGLVPVTLEIGTASSQPGVAIAVR